MVAAGYKMGTMNMCMDMCMSMRMPALMYFVSIYSDSLPKRTKSNVPPNRCGAAQGCE